MSRGKTGHVVLRWNATDEKGGEVGGGGAECNDEARQSEQLVAGRIDRQHTAGHLDPVKRHQRRTTTEPAPATERLNIPLERTGGEFVVLRTHVRQGVDA